MDDADRNHDGKIDFDEWQIMGRLSLSRLLCQAGSSWVDTVSKIKKRIPMAEDQLTKVTPLCLSTTYN